MGVPTVWNREEHEAKLVADLKRLGSVQAVANLWGKTGPAIRSILKQWGLRPSDILSMHAQTVEGREAKSALDMERDRVWQLQEQLKVAHRDNLLQDKIAAFMRDLHDHPVDEPDWLLRPSKDAEHPGSPSCW